MQASEKCIAAIKSNEAFTAVAKHLPGDRWDVITGGYGDTLNVHVGQVFTEQQADRVLRAQVASIEASINAAVHVPLTQGQYDALVDFAYNEGAPSLMRSTLLRKLNAGDYAGAVREFPSWDQANGRILAGLQARRALEQSWFEAA